MMWAVEATAGSDRIVSLLERHGLRVIVANTRKPGRRANGG
jgi:hypothetical protein